MNSVPSPEASPAGKSSTSAPAWLSVPFAGALLLILALWWWVPHALTANAGLAPGARLALETSMRDTLARVGEAALIFWGATLVWRYLQSMGEVVRQSSGTLAAAERTAYFAAQAGETERYASAMALLSSERLEVRLGGAFALERLARESERDHGPIMEVLAATLRDRAAWSEGETVPARLDGDLQAMATVIGRRHAAFDPDTARLDLHGIALARAYLPGANLSGAFLYETNLSGAILQNADLRDARLWKADLTDATLDGAHLEGADLTGVAGLTQEQLKTAHFDATTKLPQHLRGATGAKTAPSKAAQNANAGSPEDLKLPSLRV